MRADLGAANGDIGAIRGRRIGAAPWVEMGLRRLLIEAGIDLQRDAVTIAPVPGASGTSVNFGLTAAKALEDGKLDGFWANGMGAEVAVRRGVGTVVLDVRRGDGPPEAGSYTFPALVTTEERIRRDPASVEAAIKAIVSAQRALRADPSQATVAAGNRFP